ncbi:sigma-70 family RNA polymerase sigma factor [Rhizobium sp. 1399]|jgi:RNA polymerase sigma-70 factor (ECF subfamily)|uniref:sigma-70 family RNA polymerase sigma factor n=1 Tax=Rhizobium sp. 1399 TaxID=2817758 RepID=UPI002856B2A9|nr:sigma-70 family RNA polymerase sigma factor [Rhizobium sp. 1399]MDR6667889.1 RNA polymerase sigma-70 factor (ECF subfamily) [Rhizobium sp. 1399]
MKTAESNCAQLEQELVALIPALRSFARAFQRNPGDADDLVQETLLRALSHIDRFQQGTRLKSWVFTIMRNTFCTQYRVGKREIVGSEETAALDGSVPADQEWHMRGRELEAACAALAEPYRSVFEYVLIEGHSYEDAASHFHCATGTIKSRINRARLKLSDRLGEEAAR